MEARRRTLASEGPLGNAMPQSSYPSSAIKKPAQRIAGGSRMSMLPQPANRLSIMPGGSQPALHHSSSQEGLRSTMTRQEGLMSASRGDGGMYGRTPHRNAPGSVRRSSMFTSGRQSMAPGALPQNHTKDTRPMRDKAFQAGCVANISDFLISAHCPVPIGPRTFSSPTLKEFQNIFKFLVQEFTDNSSPFTKKFEDDAIYILKDLRYSAMETIGKTAFTAPGAPTYWPGMLAMLNWLVELNKAHERWYDQDVVSDPLLIPGHELPLNHPLIEDRLFWDYSAKTYTQWYVDGVEEYHEAEMELENIYDQLAQASFDECEQLETDVQKRNAELQQLQAQEPPLKRLEDEYVQLMSDKTKFIAFIDLHKQKAEKIRVGNERARSAIRDHEQQLDSLRVDLARTEEAVAAQNLSPDEVNRMNHERETLSRNLEDLRLRIAEASQFAYDQEMQVTKSMDRFEQLLADYTALGHQIGTIPPLHDGSGPSVGPNGVDYSVEMDLGLEDLSEVQSAGRRMRSVIWLALQSYGEGFRREALELANQNIALDDEYDRRGQVVQAQKEEVGNSEMKLRNMHDQAEEAKSQLQAETAENNRTVAKLENEVSAMSNASQNGVLTVQSQLEQKRIEFTELRHKTALLQDAMVTQLMSHIDVVIKAKEHTANSLKGVRSFAEAQ